MTEEVRRRLPRARTVVVDDGDDLTETLRRAAGEARVLGIAGGDGSVSGAAAVAAEHAIPLLVLPAGTLNHFARDLGIDDLAEALDAVTDGRVVAADLAEFAGRTFVNIASIGWYPQVVDARERLEGHIGKWPALLWCTLRLAVTGRPVVCAVDGAPRRVWSITVGNGRFDAGGLIPTRRRRLDEGCLEVQLVAADRPWSRLRLLAAVATGRLEHATVFERWSTARLELDAGEPQRVAHDGETDAGPPLLRAAIHPAALHVVQPCLDRTGGR